jgi:uncharacterized protein with FMN-binding domain
VSVRATLTGIAASAAILAVGWQAGAAERTAVSPAIVSAAPTVPAPHPASASKQKTAQTSGTFTGSAVATQYGSVQVQVVVRGGRIADVIPLHLTDYGQQSTQISSQAAPILRSEVLSAQSAKVASVSGATYTSDGYLSSLQAALDKARL